VKGLSREFCTCWHAGRMLCVRAVVHGVQALQQPPLIPMRLLETDRPHRRRFAGRFHCRAQRAGSRRRWNRCGGKFRSTYPNRARPPFRRLDVPTRSFRTRGDADHELPRAGLRTFQLDDESPRDLPRKSLLRRLPVAGMLPAVVLLVTPYFHPQAGRIWRIYEQVMGWVGSVKSHSAIHHHRDEGCPPKSCRTRATPLLSAAHNTSTATSTVTATPSPSRCPDPARATDVRIGPGYGAADTRHEARTDGSHRLPGDAA